PPRIRSLSSFPTRRSSDLRSVKAVRLMPLEVVHQHFVRQLLNDQPLTTSQSHLMIFGCLLHTHFISRCKRFVNEDESNPYKSAADRKSTRLNSSHSQISYA